MTRAELEEAIRLTRIGLQGRDTIPLIATEMRTAVGVLVEAAEAVLASMPKPMWKVRAWYGENDHHSNGTFATQAAARSEAMTALMDGARKVEVVGP